jgi:ABC-type Fe3+/spermidine/putrescine transport system ATPase subunit
LLIQLQNVCKYFGTSQVLCDINLEFLTGEFHTLLGPSGCGKTTLLRVIGGFETASEGTIHFDAIDVTALPPRSRRVNTVFQNYALFPHLSVEDNIEFGLKALKWPSSRRAQQVIRMLELVKLSDFAKRFPGQLSGGQQQRVALARALAPEPRALLLDEPLSALDFQLRLEMQAELREVQRSTGVTFILVTHDREEALALSDRISVMNRGAVVQTATPADLYLRPASQFVAQFVSNANVFRLPNSGDTSMLAVRPANVRLVSENTGFFDAVVRSCEFVGEETVVRLTAHDGTTVIARVRGSLRISPQSTVGVCWNSEDAATIKEHS